MKCRIPTAKELTERQIAQIEDRTTRRILKIMAVALNELYHYGPQRYCQVVSWMTDIIDEELTKFDNNPLDFWYKIDNILQEKNLLVFPREDEL